MLRIITNEPPPLTGSHRLLSHPAPTHRSVCHAAHYKPPYPICSHSQGRHVAHHSSCPPPPPFLPPPSHPHRAVMLRITLLAAGFIIGACISQLPCALVLPQAAQALGYHRSHPPLRRYSYIERNAGRSHSLWPRLRSASRYNSTCWRSRKAPTVVWLAQP